MNREPIASSARREEIVSVLREMLANALQCDPSEVSTQVTFLEMGADSYALVELVQQLQAKYQQEFPIRALFEEVTTIDALASQIERRMPPEPAAPKEVAPVGGPEPIPSPRESTRQNAPPVVVALSAPHVNEPPQVAPRAASPHVNEPERAPQPMTQELAPIPRLAAASPAPGGAIAPDGVLERIFAQQIELLSKQLDILRERGTEIAVSARVQQAAVMRFEAAPMALAASHSMPPRISPAPAVGSEMNQMQERHLRSFIERYNRRTRRSKEWAAAYRPVLADNRAVAGFRMQIKEISYPIVGARYRGARIWDIDDNEYIDISMGFGVHLFGHGAPFIQKAIMEQLELGFGVGPQPDRAGELATLFVEMTGADRVTFCQSGSEAVMVALRLARTATGREKIALFRGSYHGHFDGVLAQQSALPLMPGVSMGATRDIVVLDYGEPSALAYVRQHAHELAAVLVEPVQSRRPDLQPRAFLHELRALTEAAGTALIFDEVVTGFRAHPGGAQAIFGIRADLATYGKIPGGGLPMAAVAGKQRFMDGIDGGQWRYGDLSQPEAKRTFFAGTFNKAPLGMATAISVLRHLREQGPRLQEELNERTTRLAERLNQYFEREAVPARVVHFSSLFRFVLKGNLELFYYHLNDRGVYVWEGRTCFLSTAHTDADIDHIFHAARDGMEALRAGGFFPGPPPAGPTQSDREE